MPRSATVSTESDKGNSNLLYSGRDTHIGYLNVYLWVKYCSAMGYSATSDDLFGIFRILKALRQIAVERVAGSIRSTSGLGN